MAIQLDLIVGQHFRCLNDFEIRPCAGLNFFYGDNGAGKSSVLEAIHCLGLGRGFFRQRSYNLIQHDQDYALLRAEFSDTAKLGWQKFRSGELRLRYNQSDLANISQLLGILPVQLINAHTFLLLEGSPAERRQFIDWGVFHVEHRFLSLWQECQRFLKHRNMLLKKTKDLDLLKLYSQEFARTAEQIDQSRQQWFSSFAPIFHNHIERLLPNLDDQFTLIYRRGWDRHRLLYDQLMSSLDREIKLGSTQNGPQRADLQVRLHNEQVQEVLSRGQQKLVTLALKLAQIELLINAGKTCVVLIDDLSAELDAKHQLLVLRQLQSLGLQTFISSITVPEFFCQELNVATDDMRLFHVEQGRIKNNMV